MYFTLDVLRFIRKKSLMLELPSIVLNNINRVHYRSKTVLPSLLSQYTAPTVIPSPHGLPPKGRHDTFVIVFHEYLKHVKFKWHGCVCMATGQFAPVGLWLLSNNLVRCCSCDGRQSFKINYFYCKIRSQINVYNILSWCITF